MDQKQANQHILSCLQAGYQPDEICEELSRILKAPPELVSRFVDQVVTNHPEAVPAPLAAAPAAIETAEGAQTPEAQPQATPPTSLPQTTNNSLPPGLQAILQESPSIAPAVEPVPTQEPESAPKPAPPQRAEANNPFEDVGITRSTEESGNIDLQSLGKEVLDQLKKQHRQNDIIESVCHQTGWHWNKAQRFVARIKTQNHDLLQSRQNNVIIIVGIGIIIVGLVMGLNGISVLAEYAKLIPFAQTNPEIMLEYEPREIVFAIAASVTGFGMIIGGLFGIARVVTSR